MPPRQRSNSFVVRIWHERSEADLSHPIWRGWVQHTRSGEAAYVRDVQDMLDFMQRWSGELSTQDETPARLK